MKPTMIGIYGGFNRPNKGAAARLRLRCSHRGVHQVVLEVRDQPGSSTFGTAAAQTYQPELCDALGKVIIEAFVETEKAGHGPDPHGSPTSPSSATFGPPRPGRSMGRGSTWRSRSDSALVATPEMEASVLRQLARD